MIALDRHDSQESCHHFILLFGIGFIGRHIFLALSSTGQFDCREFPFDWRDSDRQHLELTQIRNYLAARLNVAQSSMCRVDIIWAAGKAGFGERESQFLSESLTIRNLLDFTKELDCSISIQRAWFHHFSSAGGLFEGQRLVSNFTTPDPLRDYGRIKLGQETNVSDMLPKVFKTAIYRPSSVYGLAISKNRIGLISALIRSALTGVEAEIYGSLNTLRDFVLVTDIANFVRSKVLYQPPENSTFTLCSGKPASVIEVIGLIQQVANHKLNMRYRILTDNALDNSYCQKILPSNWYPTGLKEGIAQTFMKTATYYANSGFKH